MSFNTEVENMISEYESLRKEFVSNTQNKLKKVFTKFFENNPGIKTIIWTQYTPYWNDGETCEFRIGDPNFTNAEGSELENISRYGDEYCGDNEDIFVISPGNKLEHNGVNQSELKEMNKVICGITFQDIFQDLFGDHVKVFASSEGFVVEEFDHD